VLPQSSNTHSTKSLRHSLNPPPTAPLRLVALIPNKQASPHCRVMSCTVDGHTCTAASCMYSCQQCVVRHSCFVQRPAHALLQPPQPETACMIGGRMCCLRATLCMNAGTNTHSITLRTSTNCQQTANHTTPLGACCAGDLNQAPHVKLHNNPSPARFCSTSKQHTPLWNCQQTKGSDDWFSLSSALAMQLTTPPLVVPSKQQPTQTANEAPPCTQRLHPSVQPPLCGPSHMPALTVPCIN